MSTDTFLGLPCYFDFEGQKLGEKLYQWLMLAFGAFGWLYGYYIQDFLTTVLIFGVGVLLSCVITLPAWPFYRRNPLNWAAVENSKANEESSMKKKKK